MGWTGYPASFYIRYPTGNQIQYLVLSKHISKAWYLCPVGYKIQYPSFSGYPVNSIDYYRSDKSRLIFCLFKLYEYLKLE